MTARKPPEAPEAPGVSAAAGPGADAGLRRFGAATLVAVAALTVAAHLAALGPWRGALWGAHFYAFLPHWALVLGLALVAAAAGYPLLAGAAFVPRLPWPDLEAWPAGARREALLVAAAGAGLVLWLARARHLLLGDGLPLVSRVMQGERFHPLEPLSAFLQHGVLVVARELFGGAGTWRSAWSALAVGSVLAGAAFVPVAWALARDLAGPRPAGSRPDPAPAFGGYPTIGGHPAATVTLLWLLLLAQGYVQLFAGYVENYTFFTLALGLYLLAALRFLGGRAPLLAPAAAWVLALALHLSAAALLPSLAVLVVVGFARPGRRGAAARDVALAVALFALLDLALSRLGAGYELLRALGGVTATLREGAEAAAGGYLLSARHWRDFLNEQLLIGPFALLLFAPLALRRLTRLRRVPAPRGLDAAALFALAAGAGELAACWIAGDSNLGYARNWDLLAPAGLVFTVTGLVLLGLGHPPSAGTRPWPRDALLGLALAASLFHTAPWIAVNAVPARALARFETLPLGLGRTESTLGYWYALEGRRDLAAPWLLRAVEAAPGNSRAWYFLGRLHGEEGRWARAEEDYRRALELRPDRDEYRFGLADAQVQGGRPGAALPALRELALARPASAGRWALYGVALLGAGEPDSARAALAHAASLAPGDTRMRIAVLACGAPGGFARCLRVLWPAVVQSPDR